MQTGMRCPTCNLPILTNEVVVGFPIIRIVNIDKSAMTGQEILIHAPCFQRKMANHLELVMK
jgi:hypothetical protein